MSEALRSILGLLAGLGGFALLHFQVGWSVFVAAPIAIVLYFAVFYLTTPSLRIGKIKVDSLKGGEELHRLMSDASDDMQVIYRASQAAKDPDIRAKALRLHELGNQMLTYLGQNPQNIPQARRFFTYYLDTGSDLLGKYMKLTVGNPSSAEVQRLTPETSRALDILQEAFMGQFNKLMAHEVMDVEATIQLLEKTLKMEG